MRLAKTTTTAKSLVASESGGQLRRVQGVFVTAGTTDFYIQVHDARKLPANGARPIKSFVAQANFEFDKVFFLNEIPFVLGCVIALSSTENTLTIATVSGDNADIYVELEEPVDYVTGVTTVGDYTTAVQKLDVWNSVAGGKHLMRAIVVNNAGATRYVQVFARTFSLLVDGQSKPLFERQILNGVTLPLDFGLDGFKPFEFVNTSNPGSPNGTTYEGCCIAISTTPTVFTDPITNEATIKAWYKL